MGPEPLTNSQIQPPSHNGPAGAYNSGGLVGPGRPEGGEALGLRSLVEYLIARYKLP